MRAEEKLARISSALADAGLESLVMGGHAARYYGVERNTNDFDLYVSAPSVEELKARLAGANIPAEFPPQEGPSWRPDDFARFAIGTLPDGREEWLEFWLHNHLLPSFAELQERQERGTYGGHELRFLALKDLIRSKETERESDWSDVAILEEILDGRHLAHAESAEGQLCFLSNLRSRRGFEDGLRRGLFGTEEVLRRAIAECRHPVSFAFLMPFVRDAALPDGLIVKVDEAYLSPLRKAEPGGTKHVALVEVVRRAYKRWAMDADRRDKENSGEHKGP